MVGEIVACCAGVFDPGCRGSDCLKIRAVKACHWHILEFSSSEIGSSCGVPSLPSAKSHIPISTTYQDVADLGCGGSRVMPEFRKQTPAHRRANVVRG